MQRNIVLLTATLIIMSAVMAVGQTGWGELKGFITDAEGSAIVGATLKVTGSALMGERVVTSGARGYYRIINLPPGTYKVVVTKENYSTKEFTNISVRAEKTTSYNIALEVGSFDQTIVITGDAPVIDTEAAGQKYQIDGEFRKAMPLNERNNYHEVLRMIPGVVNSYNVDAVYAYYSVHGADDYAGNSWQIDGASATAWSNFGGSTHINTDIIEDTSIQVTGISASQKMGQGASINFVTKSGGNELSGSATIQYQPTAWNDTNIVGGTPNDANLTQPSFSLGGPIFQDKLWFFASHRYTRLIQGVSRSDSLVADLKAVFPGYEPYDIDKDLHTLFGKVSYSLNDTNRLFASYQRDWGPESFGGSNRTYKALIDEGGGGPFYMLNWTTVLGDNLSVASSVSYREKPRYRRSREADPSEPSITVSRTWFTRGGDYFPSGTIGYDGNYRSLFEQEKNSWEVRSDANYFLEDLYGSHEIEFGTLLQPHSTAKTKYDHTRSPLYEYRTPLDLSNYSAGTRVWGRVYRDGGVFSRAETIAQNYAVYVNDTWKPSKRLTVTLGLRFNHAKNDDEFEGSRLSVQSHNVLSPVIGATYALTADGSDIIRGGYRKSYRAFSTQILNDSGQSGFPGGWSEFDLDGDGVFEIQTVQPPSATAPSGNDFSDQGLPYSHDFNIGYSRELPWGINLNADYTYRQFRNDFYEFNSNWIFQGGQFAGVVDTSVDEIIKFSNNTWNWREYQGIDITVNKRFGNDFQLMGSFSHEWTDLKGDWAPDNPFAYISPEKFASYGVGSEGVIAGAWGIDDQYGAAQGPNFRLNAYWNTPWYGINFSVSTLHNSGAYSGPIYEELSATDPEVTRFGPRFIDQGGVMVANPLFTTRRYKFDDRKDGQWRAPMNHKVNIRVGKEFRIDRYRLETAVDVFNIFNSDSERYTHYSGTNYDATNSSGERYYGTNRGIQAPRAAQFYARLTF